MDYAKFKNLMDQPGAGQMQTGEALRDLLNEYPYFQTAHLLYAKTLFDQQSLKYERQLKLAAAYAGDRKTLHQLIHRPGPGKMTPSFPEAIAADSPFVVSPAETTIAVSAPETAETWENPFAGLSGETAADSEKTISVASGTNILPDRVSISEEVFDEMRIDPNDAYSEEEISGEAYIVSNRSAGISDPQERIRKRLEEILGVKKETAPAEPPQKPAPVSAVVVGTTPVPAENKTNEYPPPEQQVAPEPVVPAVGAHEETAEPLEKLSLEAKKSLTGFEKAELEHALEDSLLHSLEKLPEIPKPAREIVSPPLPYAKQEEPVSLSPGTFLAWLKSTSSGGFGHVEEVHAGEEPEIQAITVSPFIKPVENKQISEIQEETGSQQLQGTEKAGPVAKDELIDRFIATEPRIVPSRTEFYSPINQAKKSVTEDENLISETLAKIYAEQGNLLKARAGYHKLSLLHPEKRAYFAALIREIDEQLNNQQKEDF